MDRKRIASAEGARQEESDRGYSRRIAWSPCGISKKEGPRNGLNPFQEFEVESQSLRTDSASAGVEVRVGLFSDLGPRQSEVRSSLSTGHPRPTTACPVGANKGSDRDYSITSSAVANISGGMVQPMAFAVLRLMISSNLVTCSTGRSAGLAPFRILSTK
jgi:hypothetical protein